MPAEQERNEGGVEWTSTLVESGTAASYPWLLACAICLLCQHPEVAGRRSG